MPHGAATKWAFVPNHFICDVVGGHSVDGNRHARVEKLVGSEAIFSFEGDLANAIGGTVSGGFCVEEDEHVVTGFTLYQSFQNPICSVTYAETQR